MGALSCKYSSIKFSEQGNHEEFENYICTKEDPPEYEGNTVIDSNLKKLLKSRNIQNYEIAIYELAMTKGPDVANEIYDILISTQLCYRAVTLLKEQILKNTDV